MKLFVSRRLTIPVVLLGCILPAGHARAQEDLQGSQSRVLTYSGSYSGGDASFAMLKADGHASEGALAWACGGDSAGLAAAIHLPRVGRTGDTQRTVWRFDQDEPDTTVLRGNDVGSLWLLRVEDTGVLTVRARSAERLVVQVPGESPSTPSAEYAYGLAGLDSALAGLGCAASPRLNGARAGVRTLLSLIEIREAPDSALSLGVVSEPRLSNYQELGRALARNYPPLQRDSGVSGAVHLSFFVLEDGTVDSTSIQVVRSTNPAFSEAAIRVAQRARFDPARVNGRPVKAQAYLPLSFQGALPEPAESPPQPAAPPRRP